MSRIENWGQNLKCDNKNYTTHYISDLPRQMVKNLRALLLEHSLDVIDDPKVEEYRTILSSRDYNNAEAIIDFVNKSPYWWHAREWARFIVGYHRPVPNADFNMHANFAGHFPHISREDDTRVAIVMDIKKADQDMHTTMKIGRYLSKQTDCPEAAIPDISNEFANRDKSYHLEEARTAAEIQWVYENGPSSCMGKTKAVAGFHSNVHPTHAYASPDITLYFVRDIANRNRVISRSVGSTINKTYVRIFGNNAVIEKLFKEHKIPHKQTGGLDNHRLLNLEQTISSNGKEVIKHIGPYIDCGKRAIFTDPDDPKYLIINPTDLEVKKRATHVGDTERSYSGKGFIDSPPMIICHYCAGSFQNNSIAPYALNGDIIQVCNDCREDRMVLAFNYDMERQYVPDEDNNLVHHEIITSSYLDRDHNNQIVRRFQRETLTFVNQEEFENSACQPYKNSTTEFLHPNTQSYVPSHDFFVTSDETIKLHYNGERALREDCIKINSKHILKKHIVDHKFKYNTISGLDLKWVRKNIKHLYMKVGNTNSDMDTVLCTAVSTTPRAGYINYNQLWINRIAARHAFGNYAHTKLEQLISFTMDIRLLPDDPNRELFPGNAVAAMGKYFSSSFSETARCRIDNMVTNMTFRRVERKRNKASYFEDIVRKKKARPKMSIDVATSAATARDTTWTTIA